MYKLLVALAVVVPMVSFAAEPGDAAEKEFVDTVAKAKTEYDAKIKVAKAELTKKLTTEMTEITKKGNLDNALKLRERIKALETGGDDTAPVQAAFVKPVVEEGPIKKITPGPRIPVTIFGNVDDSFDLA